jgi:hypothetical protein
MIPTFDDTSTGAIKFKNLETYSITSLKYIQNLLWTWTTVYQHMKF